MSRNATSPAPVAVGNQETITVLQCEPDRILTKRFDADGTKHDFTAGFLFRVYVEPVIWPGMVETLTELVARPDLCVIRGAPVDDLPLAETEPDEWVYRRKDSRPDEPASFRSVARHWVVYDFDDTRAPFDLAHPQRSIRAWHATLPTELRAARAAFFISSSAHTSSTVRGKLVVWCRKPVSEQRAAALAIHYHADPSVTRCVQPNYFAAPIFDGCADPLAGKRAPVVFDGVDAEQPSAALLKATRARPAPVRLQEPPPGDAGIVAALGPAESFVGLRFLIAGQLGGIMRKLGFAREACAAILGEWLDPAELAPRLKWALGAWEKDAAQVSGSRGLAELVGDEHAGVIVQACLAARKPLKMAQLRGES